MRKQIKKLVKALLGIMVLATTILSSMTIVTAESTEIAEQPETQATSYRTVIEIEDWGAATTKVIVDLGNPVKEGAVNIDTFSVFVTRSDQRLVTSFLESGYRTITSAYVSDEKGTPATAGKYATLEMQIGPAVTLGSPLNYRGFNAWIDCDYTITQLKDIPFGSGAIAGIVATECVGEIRELVDEFSLGKATCNNVALTYADYVPKADNGKNPLIIWLHGGGEGGTDATIPLSANKSVNLITDEIQSYFDGAYVLVPQTPTRWMDGLTSRGDGTSIYELPVMVLINDYVSKNKDIDPSRIYLGGCSNGGYLAMLMIRDYPDYFAAAFPVSEALKDSLITDTDLLKIMKTPIWFTDAATDKTTPPDLITIPTYNRLIAAGATNAHLSIFPNVVDSTGLYKNAEGTPYEYNGHWAWIYAYNNQCKDTIDGKEITIMEWMAAQTKPRKTQTSYRTVTEIEDWGAATTKVIVDLGNPVKEGAVNKDTFSVYVSRRDQRLTTSFLESGFRTITNAYVSDKKGNPAIVGKYATLEMQIGPAISLGSPLNYNGSNAWIDCNYTITQLKDIPFGSGAISGIVANEFAGEIRELVDDFTLGSATYDNVTLTYADHAPKADDGKNPLIIWLHGGGEGGTDATIPLSANKSVNLITDEIQSYFGGAYVLVPQSPTRWMDGLTSRGDGTSIYEEAVMDLINDYVSNNKDIDSNRIFLGGCSNGGYLAMLMIRDYPNYFAAAFPVSEALKDSLITDTDLLNIVKTPIWFTDAATDKTTPPDLITTPTYNRLITVGATNAHLSIFPNVVDTTGLYKNADGTPYEYNGHWAWIYVYNNQCKDTIDGKEITIMEWMAAQSLNN